jgi:CHAT domain-containing protein
VRAKFTGWFAYAGTEPLSGQLSRLVGSASEVEASARSWTEGSVPVAAAGSLSAGTGSTTASLLEGASARRDRFLEMAAHRPAIVHLATHILMPVSSSSPGGGITAGPKGEGMIAFGLGSGGGVEALSTSEIGMLDVPGAVVTMTGCASGGGDIRAGAGLLGLTRAWQLAGARAVIATAWPVEDTTGELFAAFYRHLRSAPPPEALRRSQVEMLRSGTWRSAAGYWASYQITGGARP